jgi:hypothetical protein
MKIKQLAHFNGALVFPYFCLLTGLILVNIGLYSPAAAQDKRRGLSQLEFDIEMRRSRARGTQLNTANMDKDEAKAALELRALMEGKTPDQVITGDSEAGAARAPGAVLITGVKTTNLVLEEEQRFIPPRLKGPFVDEMNASSITSKQSWAPLGKSCLELSSTAELCGRAKALKEVLNRYSGSDDFYDFQCKNECSQKADIARLVDLTLPEITPAVLRTVAIDKQCHLRIQNLSDQRWLLLTAASGTCACLPKDCFE